MISFYIDSATGKAHLVIYERGKVRGSKTVPVGPLAKDDLFLQLEGLFKECHLDLKDLHFVGIGIGPGSYMGMRVASSIGATLAYSLQIPLVALNSMEGYEYDQPFVTVFDAKRGKVYVLEEGGEPKLIPIEELQAYKNFAFLTPHIEEFQNREGNWVEAGPDFAKIGAILNKKFENKEFTDPTNVHLIYLQNPNL